MTPRAEARWLRNQRLALTVVVVAWAAGLCALADGLPDSRPAALEPAWSFTSPQRIEWLHVAAAESPRLVWIATADGVFAVDGVDGAPLGAGPTIRARGLRLAQGEPGVTARGVSIVFEREGIYGLRPDPRNALAWAFREAADARAAEQGDPERLSRWSDVGVSEDRVVALNVDGRIIILDRESGAVCWREDFGALPLVRLHVSAGRIAVLARQKGRVWATILALREPAPYVSRVELGADWPVWSSLADDRLVVVGSSLMRVIESDHLVASTCLDAPQLPARSLCRISTRHVAVARCSEIIALDASTGEDVWRTRVASSEPDDSMMLRCEGGFVIARSRDAVWLLERETGRLQVQVPVAAGAVAVVGDGVRVVTEREQPRRWCVDRYSSAGSGPAIQLQLPGACDPAGAGVRQTVWLGDAVIISSGHTVAFYALRRSGW